VTIIEKNIYLHLNTDKVAHCCILNIKYLLLYTRTQGFKEKFCKSGQDCVRPPEQADTSFNIEEMRSNKTTIYKCEWWSTTRMQKSKWILHNYFSKSTKNSWPPPNKRREENSK